MKLGHDGNGNAVSPPSVLFSSLFFALQFVSFPLDEKKGGRPTGPHMGRSVVAPNHGAVAPHGSASGARS